MSAEPVEVRTERLPLDELEERAERFAMGNTVNFPGSTEEEIVGMYIEHYRSVEADSNLQDYVVVFAERNLVEKLRELYPKE